MGDKLMYISDDDTIFVDFNQWLKHLDNRQNEPTNQISIKVPKVVKQTNKKMLLQVFGDKCNKLPNVPSLPGFLTINFAKYNSILRYFQIEFFTPSMDQNSDPSKGRKGDYYKVIEKLLTRIK